MKTLSLNESSRNTDTVIEAIRASALFSEVEESVLRGLIADCGLRCVEYEGGETIYDSAISCRNVSPAVILSGRAEVYSSDREREVCLRVLESGSVFGIAGLFSGESDFISTIRCKRTCTVALFEPDAFVSLLENNNTFMLAYVKCLSDRIAFLNRKIRQFTAGSAERKLAFFLEANVQGSELRLTYSISRVAEMLDIGRASLYRAIDTLSDADIIEKDGKLITIKDMEKLRKFCNERSA